MGQSVCLRAEGICPWAVGTLTSEQPTRALLSGSPFSGHASGKESVTESGKEPVKESARAAGHAASEGLAAATRHATWRGVSHPRASAFARFTPSTPSTAGFTLIEMMVVVAVLAIIATAAIPNFTSFIHNSKLRSEASKLFVDIETARSEAARRNASVTVCPSADGVNCSEDWSLARIIFLDTDDNGVRDGADPLVRNSDKPAVKTAITASGLDKANRIAFRSSGTAVKSPVAAWQFCETGSTLEGQTVSLTGSGRAYTQSPTPCN